MTLIGSRTEEQGPWPTKGNLNAIWGPDPFCSDASSVVASIAASSSIVVLFSMSLAVSEAVVFLLMYLLIIQQDADVAEAYCYEMSSCVVVSSI